MAIFNLPLAQINEFQTIALFELSSRGPGTYRIPLQVKGNSILSSLLVTAVDVGTTVKINYYQTTSGSSVNERSELLGHKIKAVASEEADTIIVARMHFKPVIEAIVEGGNATFGVMVTMVSAFASDIESSLFLDQDPFTGKERGIPLITVDDATDTFRMLRSNAGQLLTAEDLGEPFHLAHYDTLANNQSKPLTSHECYNMAVRISQLSASAFAEMIVSFKVDGQVVRVLRTSVSHPNAEITLTPPFIASRGSRITLDAERISATGQNKLDVFLDGYEFKEDEYMPSISKIVFNRTGSIILPFKAVAWLNDNSITPADADVISIADFAGVTIDAVANLGYGKIIKIGEVPGALAGLGAIAGQPVYLSGTPGALTLTPPVSGTILRVGFAEPPSGSSENGEATSLFIEPHLISEG